MLLTNSTNIVWTRSYNRTNLIRTAEQLINIISINLTLITLCRKSVLEVKDLLRVDRLVGFRYKACRTLLPQGGILQRHLQRIREASYISEGTLYLGGSC